MAKIIAFAAFTLLVSAQLGSTQKLKPPFGQTKPKGTVEKCEQGLNFPDQLNMCYYWQCLLEPASCANIECANDGVRVYEHGKCWCVCPPEFQGDHLCRLPTNPDLVPANPSDKCIDGKPDRDYCAEAKNPCNGRGECNNQCGGFWCDCQKPFTAGKRCEEHSCDNDNQCGENGVCLRGRFGNNEFRRCRCKKGFTGYRCEIRLFNLDN